jgi:hypothetical protein
MEAHQDRVLFGTDSGPEPRWYPIYFRFLETAARDMSYSILYRAPQGSWLIDGLDLPDTTLEKLYSLNARRLLRLGSGR